MIRAVIGLLLLLAPPARAAENFHARALAAAEFRQAEGQTAVLLGRESAGQAEYDRRQSFVLEVSGRPAQTLVAVKYPAPHTPGNSYDCALGFLPQDAAPYLIVTIGTGEREAISCTALSAAGFLEDTARPMPGIALVYDAHSPNFPVSTPLLLEWDARAGRYAINEKLSRILGDRQGTETIAGIRQALREIRRMP